ncbi:MAG: hypothetical protein WD534_11100 [Phycisphaeraceae bacterium]
MKSFDARGIYSLAPMDLLARILRHRMCEVFALIEWNRLNQTMADTDKWPAITRAFGGEDWRPAINMAGLERQQFLVSTFRRAMEQAGARFTWHFSMRDKSNRLIYWLFFGSGGLDGLYQMKRAMRRVDPTGTFSFSDFRERQAASLFQYSDSELASELADNLSGQALPISAVREHVLTRTPGTEFNNALANLEQDKRLQIVESPPGRRKRSFAKYQKDNPRLVVRFL